MLQSLAYGVLGTALITCFISRFIMIKTFILLWETVNPEDWPEENGN